MESALCHQRASLRPDLYDICTPAHPIGTRLARTRTYRRWAVPSTLLELAEALIPLTVAGAVLERSARRERARIDLEQVRVALAQQPAGERGRGVLDRMHEARMRRRALRMMARHHSGTVR